MEVAAVVPVKLKRRKVSAVRDFPKGCGRNAPPIPPKQPIEQPDLPVKAAEAEEVPRSDVPNGMPALAPASTEAVLPAEAEKPADVEVPSGPGAPATESKEEEEELAAEVKGTTAPEAQAVVVVMKAEANGDEGLPEQAVKLEVLELSNGCLDQPDVLMGSSDQPELLAMVTRVDVSVKQCYSKKYPPPKRREVSAVRDFPAGCGRGVPLMIREGILEIAAAVDDSSMRKTLDVVKEPAVSPQLAAEDSVEIAPTKKAEMEVKKDKPKKIQVDLGETDGGVRMKPTSASLKSKSLDGEKKPAAQELIVPEDYVEEVTPNGKAEMEMKKDESKKSRVDHRETSSQGRVKSVSASLKSNSLDGKRLAVKKLSVMEGSVRVASTKKAQGNTEQVREQAQEISSEVRVKSTEERNEKKTDVRYVKPVGKSLAIKEAQESKPSLDSRFHSGSKSVVKSGISSVGKSLDKGFIKHQTDAKVLKRKFSEEAESRGRVTNNQTEGDLALEAYGDRMIVQALMAAQNCPWGQGRMSGGFSSRSVALKNVKREQKSSSKHSAFKGASVSRLKNEASTEDEEDSVHQDEENSKALTVYNKQHEWSVNVTPLVPPKPHRKGGENDEISDRNKVKRALRLFQLLCRKLLQGEESKSKDLGRVHRVDLKASAVLKENNEWVNSGKPIIGHVPGVEVGDEFHYRVELSIVGLHRPFQGGIDYTKKNGMVLATSIVASGGYPDDIDSSDVLVYSGSGGNPAGGDKQGGDQKLERGNLSLKNCIDAETPVRVIYGFKVKGNEHDAKAKTITTFTYDGLYVVEKYWSEKGPRGFSVFKFQLRRMAGQPELALKEVKRSKKAKVREGLCIKDITEGKENMPICAVNTIDDDRPMPFKYITENIYPSWYVHTPSRGCDCTDGCLDSEKCACAVKNGGEIPFNYNGAIVQAKPLVYECGPSCNCPPSCYNRVSQHGIKIPLEIFKTKSRGWGVRSLYSIPSGTFICEYIGELLKDSDAEQRSNDEYLFDIGHNYEDKTLWEGLPTLISGLQSSSVCETLDDAGFTIDAAEFGNVGRFINHSCSPNIYAQNVLYDHDDKRMPHIMFFAADNIPPLQELTYHYNYTVDQVRDSEGNIKRKNCCCGAPECTGRLY